MRYTKIIHIILLLNVAQLLKAQSTDSLHRLYVEESYELLLTSATACYQKDTSRTNCLEKAAQAAHRLGQFGDAKKLFHTLESKDPAQLSTMKSLANIYEAEDNLPKAIKYYNRLLEQDSTHALYTRKLGQLLLKAELPLEAYPHFAKAYKLNPKDVYTIKGLVEVLTQAKQLGKVDTILQEALEVDSSNIQFNLLYARNKYMQKQYHQTVDQMEQLQGKVDFNHYYSKLLGFSYLQIDSLDQAIFYLRKSLVGEGNPERASYYLGIAFERKDDMPTALKYYNQALAASVSEDIDVYHKNLARMYKHEGDLRSAIKHYEGALEYSNDPLLYYLLAQVCDIYYKDKSVAVRYYKKYEDSEDQNRDFKKYAKERRLYLKEQIHLSK